MVNQYGFFLIPFYGLVPDQFVAAVDQALQKFMGSPGTQVWAFDEWASYTMNRLVGDDYGTFVNTEDAYNAAAYHAAWNKLYQISPTDTELSYYPMQFNGFYKSTHVFRLLNVVNSNCLYQYLVQNISSPDACADGELDNYNRIDQQPYSTLIYNASYGASQVIWNPYDYSSSCGADYPFNCTTTTTTTSTVSPILYEATLRVGLVLGDAFAERNSSAPGGYSGYAVQYLQLVASQLGASLSFHELTVGNRTLPTSSNINESSLNCATSYGCQWNYLLYEELLENRSDLVVGLIPVTNAIAQQTLPILFSGGQYLAGTNLLFRCATIA